MSKRVFKTELDAVNNSLQVQVNNSISKNIVDAKGDIVTASAADTPIRLAVGNNGETLVADSSQTTGLRYSPPVGSLANPIINGGMDIWQRGTSSTASQTFAADRWQPYMGVGNGTWSRQSVGDSTNLPNIQYCLRAQRNSGQTTTSINYVWSNIETVNSIPFAGKNITLSFYARAGANYSSASNALSAALRTGTGTDENGWLAGYTGQATPLSAVVTLTTTWQRFAVTGTLASNITEMAPAFSFTPSGTAGANDYFEITGVQIDVGTWTASTAPTFRRSGGTLAGELAACQRYYYRITPNGVNSTLSALGAAGSTTGAVIVTPTPVTLRTNPSSIDYSTLSLIDAAGNNTAITALALSGNTTSGNMVNMDVTVASGLTAQRPYWIRANASTSAYLGFSSEL